MNFYKLFSGLWSWDHSCAHQTLKWSCS